MSISSFVDAPGPRARRRQRIREVGHLQHLGMRDVGKATPYLLLDGKLAERQMSLF